MLNIPESVKTLFKTDGTHKNFRVQFPNGEYPDITNDNIVRESLHFTESLCSQSVFRFGLAEASVLEFETVGIGNMYGMTINASIEIDLSSLSASEIADIEAGTWDGEFVNLSSSDLGFPYYRVPLGVFRIEKCPRNHGAMTHRQVQAYSQTPESFVPFPEKSLAKEFYMRLSGLIGLADGTGLTEQTTVTPQPCDFTFRSTSPIRPIPSGCLASARYLYSGNYYEIDIWLCTGTIDNPVNALNYAVCDYDTVMPTGSFSPEQAEMLKAVIAQSLEDAGIDLTVEASTNGGNNDLTQIYTDNLEALNAKTFALGMTLSDQSGTIPNYSPRTTWEYWDGQTGEVSHEYSIQINKNNPVIGGEDTSNAFYGGGYPLGYSSTRKKVFLYPKISATDNVFLRTYDIRTSTVRYIRLRYTPDQYAPDPVNIIPFLTTAFDVSSVRQFSAAASSAKIEITNSGAFDDTFYSFLGQEKTVSDTLVEAIELYAKFYKADRYGGYEVVSLSSTSPLLVPPGRYEECWWDEYDVAPIGSVTVTYQEKVDRKTTKENTTSIVIGSGQSIYDMTSNTVLKNLTQTDLTTVRNLIKSAFASRAKTLAFTPVELSMQGWPWMEAGDALRITAEDGTVVKTYALRVEMSGIQHLMSTITAEGGEIVGET